MKDLISFVLISALIISAAAYSGQFFSRAFYNINDSDLQMVMMSIMIIITISNYLAVALHKVEKNFNAYLWYAVIILGIFVYLAVMQLHSPIFTLVKEFYEIQYLKPRYWGLVIIISIVSSTLLFVLQNTRKKWIVKL